MKDIKTTKKQPLSIIYEELGLFPRSFNRVLDRFFKQVFSDVETLVLMEYRFYRYLFLNTLQCFFLLIFVPFLVHFFSKSYFVKPMVEFYFNSQQTEIFLNSHQQKLAFSELENFEEKLYFESLISNVESISTNKNVPHSLNLDYEMNQIIFDRSKVQQSLQQKTNELALRYNEESIEAITNFFADLISFGTLCFLFFRLSIQINITKSFLLEVFFGLDDSKKSLLILFITDLSVGYHSPNIWELFFQFFFFHYGISESETTIFLLVATLPVLLDVLFKYLIFRHLNRASPATVATYHAMIE
jgi:hypothetical protein